MYAVGEKILHRETKKIFQFETQVFYSAIGCRGGYVNLSILEHDVHDMVKQRGETEFSIVVPLVIHIILQMCMERMLLMCIQ
jgi:hypothetical protein